MLQLNEPSDYVLSTGVGATVKDFLETSFKVVDLDYRNFVELDSKFYRPNEVTKLIGDSTKAKRDLGWVAETKWNKLAETMVEADINRLRKDID
jgi:GDPmannose 4,6-dehydratase